MNAITNNQKLGCIGVLLLLAIGIVAALPGPMQFLAQAISELAWLNLAISLMLAWTGLFITICKLRCYGLDSRSALIAYFWAALGMAGVYSILNEFHDGCIRIENAELPVTIIDFVYFSYVSVTTLGYGDMVPDHVLIRILVVCQILFAGFLLYRVSMDKGDARRTIGED